MTRTPAIHSRSRRWLRFSLAGLLAALTLVSLYLATLVNRATQQKRALAAMNRLNGTVEFAYERDSLGTKIVDAAPTGAMWLRDLIGAEYFDKVTRVTLDLGQATDEDLAELRGLKDLECLTIHSTHVTDAGAAHLAAFKNLRYLDLINTKISDNGLTFLQFMPDLEEVRLPQRVEGPGLKNLARPENLLKLNLATSWVTDDGLEPLERCINLQSLILTNTDIGNAGLRHLRNLANLTSLNLSQTQISDEGLEHLSRLTSLQSLCIGETRVMGPGLQYLAHLKQLASLDIWSRSLQQDFDKAAVARLQQKLPNLEVRWPFEIARTMAIAHVANPTHVVMVSPRDNASDVDVRTLIEIHFSKGIRLTTLNSNTIKLNDSDGEPVAAQLGSDIEGDVVRIKPHVKLRPNTVYTLFVTADLVDKDRAAVAAFQSTFKTGADVSRPAMVGCRCTKAKLADMHGPTAIAVGPDGNVYVSTYNGKVFRLRIDSQTGLSPGKEELLTIANKKILGLTFDPESSANHLVAWITHDERKAELKNEGTFSGVLSKIEIPAVGQGSSAAETPYIVGLPSGWHPLNGCTFGPDNRIYISIGSMNRLGDDPVRPETLLSSSVVVADVRNPAFNGGQVPLNVQTAGPVNYDPNQEGAPLKLFATGFRQMYRICWHSNGNLYGGVNQNDGTGRSDTPSKPGVPALHSVFPDEDLVRIVEGGYYGHPNPTRNQFVLLGGNPTAEADPWEVPEYPVGVQPEPNFNPRNLIFNLKTIDGTSANGCTEYTLPGRLNGRLLICFYEGTHTVHTFSFNRAGTEVVDHWPLLTEQGESMTFTQPLDVAVHPAGWIFVADFGNWSSFGTGGAIWSLRPKE